MKKISSSSLYKSFSEYIEDEYTVAYKFIQKEFVKQKKNNNKDILYHLTCATNVENEELTEFVQKVLKELISINLLSASGLRNNSLHN